MHIAMPAAAFDMSMSRTNARTRERRSPQPHSNMKKTTCGNAYRHARGRACRRYVTPSSSAVAAAMTANASARGMRPASRASHSACACDICVRPHTRMPTDTHARTRIRISAHTRMHTRMRARLRRRPRARGAPHVPREGLGDHLHGRAHVDMHSRILGYACPSASRACPNMSAPRAPCSRSPNSCAAAA